MVEDEILVADVILEALEETYAASHVSDVEIALERMGKGGIDLMLLDCSLAGGSADVLIREADRAHVPIILMSGDPEMADRIGSGRKFVLKPFTLSVLRGTIAELVPPG
ncbi:MAG: response regulator transcription factor [Acetobacteraceae bacterium]|nr:response regulator transcription factor [Acetobacteraceae bacterium]